MRNIVYLIGVLLLIGLLSGCSATCPECPATTCPDNDSGSSKTCPPCNCPPSNCPECPGNDCTSCYSEANATDICMNLTNTDCPVINMSKWVSVDDVRLFVNDTNRIIMMYNNETGKNMSFISPP